MRGVSIIKYYKNIKILCQTTGFPSYQNKTFPPQISQELLIGWDHTVSALACAYRRAPLEGFFPG